MSNNCIPQIYEGNWSYSNKYQILIINFAASSVLD